MNDHDDHRRTITIDGRASGFIRQARGGHWQACSYRRGMGTSPLSSEQAAEQWVREQDVRGPIQGYSR